MKRFVWPQYLVGPQNIEGAFEAGNLIRVLDRQPDDPELMHPRSQGTRVETQNRCGSVPALDAPAGI